MKQITEAFSDATDRVLNTPTGERDFSALSDRDFDAIQTQLAAKEAGEDWSGWESLSSSQNVGLTSSVPAQEKNDNTPAKFTHDTPFGPKDCSKLPESAIKHLEAITSGDYRHFEV